VCGLGGSSLLGCRKRPFGRFLLLFLYALHKSCTKANTKRGCRSPCYSHMAGWTREDNRSCASHGERERETHPSLAAATARCQAASVVRPVSTLRLFVQPLRLQTWRRAAKGNKAPPQTSRESSHKVLFFFFFVPLPTRFVWGYATKYQEGLPFFMTTHSQLLAGKRAGARGRSCVYRPHGERVYQILVRLW